MPWLFGQTWIWYLIAFVVGVLLAWLLFVLPAQRRLRAQRGDGGARPAAGAAAGTADAEERTSILDKGKLGAAAAGAAAVGAAGAAVAATRGGSDEDEATAKIDRDGPTTVDDAPTEQLPAFDPALATLDKSRSGLPAAPASATTEIPIAGSADPTTEIPVVQPDGDAATTSFQKGAAVAGAAGLGAAGLAAAGSGGSDEERTAEVTDEDLEPDEPAVEDLEPDEPAAEDLEPDEPATDDGADSASAAASDTNGHGGAGAAAALGAAGVGAAGLAAARQGDEADGSADDEATAVYDTTTAQHDEADSDADATVVYRTGTDAAETEQGPDSDSTVAWGAAGAGAAGLGAAGLAAGRRADDGAGADADATVVHAVDTTADTTAVHTDDEPTVRGGSPSAVDDSPTETIPTGRHALLETPADTTADTTTDTTTEGEDGSAGPGWGAAAAGVAGLGAAGVAAAAGRDGADADTHAASPDDVTEQIAVPSDDTTEIPVVASADGGAEAATATDATGTEETTEIPVTPEAGSGATTAAVAAGAVGAGALGAAGLAAASSGDGSADGPYGAGSAQPAADGSAPGPEYTIKANADSMLYHKPESPYFDRTNAQAWFSSVEAAEAAGFVAWFRRAGAAAAAAAAAPVGGAPDVEPGDHPNSAKPSADGASPHPDYVVKANADSKRYHTAESPYFLRTRATVWFRSAEDAEAAGFAAWRRT